MDFFWPKRKGFREYVSYYSFSRFLSKIKEPGKERFESFLFVAPEMSPNGHVTTLWSRPSPAAKHPLRPLHVENIDQAEYFRAMVWNLRTTVLQPYLLWLVHLSL